VQVQALAEHPHVVRQERVVNDYMQRHATGLPSCREVPPTR
jgi:hypothetical protein